MVKLSSNTVGSSNASGRFQSISNPYAFLPRKRTIWDRLLNALGMRSGYDKAQEEYNLAGAEYNAQLEQLASEEAYNSPLQQAQRMREAGLNPDLTGVSGEPASEFDNQQQSPDVSVSSDAQDQLIAFSEGVMNIFTTALGLTNSIQGVVRNKIQNSILRTQDESSFKEFAESMFPYFIPETPDDQVLDDGSVISNIGQSLQLAEIFAGNLPKKMRNKFVNEAYQFFHSAPGTAKEYNEWRNRVKARKDYYTESHSFYSENDEVLSIITDGLTSVQEEIFRNEQSLKKRSQVVSESQLDATEAEARNNETYFNSLDSSLQAQTENAQNRFNEENFDMNATLNKALGDMIKKLDDASQKDGIKGGLASIAMALLASFRLYITTQGLPSVSRSTTSGPKGTTVSSSFGL